MAEQTPGLRRQRRMDRQGVGLAQQFLEARGAVNAERQFDTVRQVGIVEHDAKVECLGAQRDRSADAPQPDDAEILHPEPPDHRRSEEHTSELQSLAYLVCRLLLEKKKKKTITHLNRNKKKQKQLPYIILKL